MPADELPGADPLARLAALKPKDREPARLSALLAWINNARAAVGLNNERLEWLIASTVVVAAMQRVIDADGHRRFLLKGGTYLQYRLAWSARPTKDVDGIVRGDLDDFIDGVDRELRENWGPLEFERGEVTIIQTPAKIIKPRKFDVRVRLRGDVWRKITVEVSPDEAGATDEYDLLDAPSLAPFGLPTPEELFGIAMRYQIAQKIHASTDPHNPPNFKNDRARDVVDLLLLRSISQAPTFPSLEDIRRACVSVFDARAAEAVQLGRPARSWPAVVVAHDHWDHDFNNAAQAGGITLTLHDAVDVANEWIAQIDDAQ